MTSTKADHLKSPIFSLVEAITLCLHWLNAVEWLKWVVKAAYRRFNKRSPVAAAAQLDPFTADLFIIGKWVLLLWWLVHESYSPVRTWITAYLLFTNVFTYFHYHAWKIMSVGRYLTAERIQRRLINSILAVAYSMVAFSYLYGGPFRASMTWSASVDSPRMEALLFSITNSLTVGYGSVQPGTLGARALCTSQLVNMFFFATIIVSASLSTMFGSPAQPPSKD
jgi:hypothetical protein